ncbi:putative acid trehalase [Microthyrium microscopicum]|uniref:alpha,alpha-trehalase n=1 Tax=Microthyrium microscopicum TaxID=703497 RepID=A0A6A6UQ40_9PEZI|nr:putative acid trehalase [Microthyrium microscopicum]
MKLLILNISLFLTIFGNATATIYETRFPGVTYDDDAWTLTTTNLDQGHYQSRISLANGYFGINLAAVGPFMDFDVQVDGDNVNGWPLFGRRQSFATIAGFYGHETILNGTNFAWLYQYGEGESAISGVPHWAGLLIELGGQLLNASVDSSQISNFSSTLDMRRGLMAWTYDWTPSGSSSIHVLYEMLVHKLYVNQAAVRLTVTPAEDSNVTIIDVLDGDCAVRTNSTGTGFDQSSAAIWSAVSPYGVANVTAYIYSTLTAEDDRCLDTLAQVTSGPFLGSNESSIAQGVNAKLTAGQSTTFTKFVGAASTDAFPDPSNIAKMGSKAAAQAGWDSLLKSHAEEWAYVMPTDSVDSFVLPSTGKVPEDPDVVELHINAVTNPFHLIQNTVGENAIAAANNNSDLDTHSISVGGLASDSYAGFIFWDADVWMAPGLVVSHPQAAKQIAGYRAKHLDQAKDNINTAYQSSKNQTGRFSEGGAVYPWTDGRYGTCTGTGPCFDYEYHINGDIGLQLFNYYAATGDTETFKDQYFPIYDAVAWFYAELLTFNSSTETYGLMNATDPDEYANFADNVGYTLALIQSHLQTANVLRDRLGLPQNATWADTASKIKIPTNEEAKIVLEYAAMNGSIQVKQADVVLIDDFLGVTNEYSLPNLDYYAGKQSANGPGMTYGVFSIVANEISPSGCSAYTYDLEGSQPYTRAPWFQYSEQLLDDFGANGGTHPAYPFLTGQGGANRVSVYGYLGLRLSLDSLNVSPNLPPQISYLRYRTIYWQGHPVSASSNTTHTTLTRLPSSLANANTTYLTNAIPVTIGADTSVAVSLPPNGTIVVTNRLIGYNATIDGNIAQCKPANSSQAYLPGLFPLAAVDGAISTKWQPVFSNITSSVIVDLGAPGVGINITGFHVDWAQAPPMSWQVDFSTSADFSASSTAYNSTNVTISTPYIAANADDITAYVGNTTDVSLPSGVVATRYVRLSISGSQGAPSTAGASVAEFAVLRDGGGRLVPNGVVTSL